MDANLAAIIAIAASIAVPMIILMLQSGQSGRASFATEARLLLDAQTARAEQAEAERDKWRAGSPSVQQELSRIDVKLDDHMASSDRVHANLYEDMSEIGREMGELRRMVRDLFNKRGDAAAGGAS